MQAKTKKRVFRYFMLVIFIIDLFVLLSTRNIWCGVLGIILIGLMTKPPNLEKLPKSVQNIGGVLLGIGFLVAVFMIFINTDYPNKIEAMSDDYFKAKMDDFFIGHGNGAVLEKGPDQASTNVEDWFFGTYLETYLKGDYETLRKALIDDGVTNIRTDGNYKGQTLSEEQLAAYRKDAAVYIEDAEATERSWKSFFENHQNYLIWNDEYENLTDEFYEEQKSNYELGRYRDIDFIGTMCDFEEPLEDIWSRYEDLVLYDEHNNDVTEQFYKAHKADFDAKAYDKLNDAFIKEVRGYFEERGE